jgi:hypothetical protein
MREKKSFVPEVQGETRPAEHGYDRLRVRPHVVEDWRTQGIGHFTLGRFHPVCNRLDADDELTPLRGPRFGVNRY